MSDIGKSGVIYAPRSARRPRGTCGLPSLFGRVLPQRPSLQGFSLHFFSYMLSSMTNTRTKYVCLIIFLVTVTTKLFPMNLFSKPFRRNLSPIYDFKGMSINISSRIHPNDSRLHLLNEVLPFSKQIAASFLNDSRHFFTNRRTAELSRRKHFYALCLQIFLRRV